ncbi:hypothetical protein [Paenibacillus apiarius]|uniref:hypothetical protein n=1 Tax=Paenibacillus apiarius TaxID=46240 RepID=UPI003B3A9850
MANKYCNLVGSKKISEDFNNINVGFDKVQQDMDSKSSGDHRHPNATDTTDGFMSAADKAKSDASTSAATPGTLAQRDAAGRMKAAAPDAADDVARKAEVDTVQTDLDSHKADAVMHVTSEDHEKLDGIEEGAEANQNAFSKVNDIEASEKTDSLTFKGGVGIKITTNPVTNEVTVTSTGESTPGSHGSSHTEHGADPIPIATESEGGLMSAADKTEFKQQAATLEDNEHRIDGVESDLADVPAQPLELQPGIQIVESDHGTPFNFGEVKGRTEIQEGVGIVNVRNPFALVTGANLLPPFTEWDARPGDVIVGPYKLSKTVTAQYQATISPKIRVIRGHTYTLSSTRNGRMVLGEYKEDGSVIGYPIAEVTDNNGFFSQSVTIGADTDYIIVQLSNVATSGAFYFENTMLTIGTEPKPFAPQQRSIWAAECQLAANPVDGSNPDVLYVGDDGLPYVLGKWGKVTLDGALNWSMGDATPQGGKQVKVTGLVMGAVPASGHVSKYDGKYIPTGTTGDAPDLQAVSVNGSFYISIANTDSGWGADYTPDNDEIQAYFWGWKLTVLGASVGNTPPYNGDGDRAWIPIMGFDGTNGTSITPTTESAVAIAAGWKPYRLQYLKAKSTVEPVKNYETGATLCKGSNMVEVGSGIVIREKAIPVTIGLNYLINHMDAPNSALKHRTNNIMSVYRNNVSGSNATIATNNGVGLGGSFAYITPQDFDPSAVYHVTYTMLDPTLVAPIGGAVATNLRGTVSDLVQDVGDVQRRLSVVETQKAEKDLTVEWIKPTLLNGWTHYQSWYANCAYSKNAGVVTIRGLVKAGTQTPGTYLFILPKGFRPKEQILFSQLTSAGSTNPSPITIEITPSGGVYIGTNALETWTNLTGISFPAEQ